MKDSYYFRLVGTENEHSHLEHVIRTESAKKGWEVIYYRKYKTGHVPCYRECKIIAPKWAVDKMFIDNDISDVIVTKFMADWRP